MNLSELIRKLIDLEVEHGQDPVILAVGGDGAIHEGLVADVDVYERGQGLVVKLESS